MAIPEFTHADVVQLLKIQEDIRHLLAKYRENTPAIVPAIACVRIAQALLQVYPEADRTETINSVIIPFLRGATLHPKSGLILPPGFKLN